MGSLLGSICYATSTEATDAYYSGKDPSYTAGTISYLSYFEKPSGTWEIVRKSIDSNGTITGLTSVTAPSLTFPTCDQSTSFIDGVTIGWGILAAMVAAYAFKLMQRAL